MAYNDFSFGKYRSYRKNRRRYEVSANALPCLTVILICMPLFDFIKCLMVGVLILVGVCIVWEFFKKRKQAFVVKDVEEENTRKNQIVKENLVMGTTEKGYVNKNNQKLSTYPIIFYFSPALNKK